MKDIDMPWKCIECEEGHKKRCAFNYSGEKTGKWCKEHAPVGTINVLKNSCEDCEVTPSFGYPEEKKKKMFQT